MLAAVSAQFILGIVTLLHGVPVSLGGMHQAGAVILLGCLLALLHGTSGPIQRAMTIHRLISQPAYHKNWRINRLFS